MRRTKRLSPLGICILMILFTIPVFPQGLSSCAEDLAMIPEEYLQQLQISEKSQLFQTYTIVPVTIDSFGADPMTPWIVHVSSLRIRSGPSTTFSQLGILPAQSQVSGIYNLILETDEEWIAIEYGEEQGHISRTGVYRIHPRNLEYINQYGNIPYGREIVNRWWGVPISYEPDDLVQVPSSYTTQISGRSYLLRQEAADAAIRMIDAARLEGLNFLIGSPYRSGSSQQSIYNNYVASSGLAQRFSAPPGHSEHQLGSTMDFTNPSTGQFLRNTDPQYHWLNENASHYGFFQSYTADNIEETGYIEEPWHWRYWGMAESSDSMWKIY